MGWGPSAFLPTKPTRTTSLSCLFSDPRRLCKCLGPDGDSDSLETLSPHGSPIGGAPSLPPLSHCPSLQGRARSPLGASVSSRRDWEEASVVHLKPRCSRRSPRWNEGTQWPRFHWYRCCTWEGTWISEIIIIIFKSWDTDRKIIFD